jgi:hypothetical protein
VVGDGQERSVGIVRLQLYKNHCHYGQSEHGDAALLQGGALVMRQFLLPEDHSDTAKSLSSLASGHNSQGEYGKAMLLHKEEADDAGAIAAGGPIRHRLIP